MHNFIPCCKKCHLHQLLTDHNLCFSEGWLYLIMVWWFEGCFILFDNIKIKRQTLSRIKSIFASLCDFETDARWRSFTASKSRIIVKLNFILYEVRLWVILKVESCLLNQVIRAHFLKSSLLLLLQCLISLFSRMCTTHDFEFTEYCSRLAWVFEVSCGDGGKRTSKRIYSTPIVIVPPKYDIVCVNSIINDVVLREWPVSR